MFSKNIKTLSLFLVLAAVMIVAVGAVSANDVTNDAGSATGNITLDDGAVIAGTSGGDASGSISGSFVTNDQVKTGDYVVDKGQAINSTGKNPDTVTGPSLTIGTADQFLYNDSACTIKSGATATLGTTTVGADGKFTGTVTLANANGLISGNTYYLKLTAPEAYAFNATTAYATVATANYTVPVTYMNTITLDKNTSTISYGDDWTYSGILTDTKGVPQINKDVTLKITENELSTKNTVTVKTGADGKFKFNTTFWNAAGNDPLATTTTTNYTVTITSTGPTTAVAGLNVTKKNVKVNVNLNSSTINFGDKLNYTATVVDANGKLVNKTITATIIIKDAQGNTVTNTLSPGFTEGTYNNDEILSSTTVNNYVPGTYYIILSTTDANYNFDPVTVTAVVNSLSNITIINPNPVTGNPSADTKINLKFNTTTAVGGAWTVIIYDSNNVPTFITDSAINSAAHDVNLGTLPKGDYTVVATFTPTKTTGYTASNATASISIKNVEDLTVKPPADFVIGTTGNSTYLNITSSIKNTTVSIIINNKTLDNVQIKDGSATVDLGKLALDAGEYNITVVYAGDADYNPVNITVTVNVNPEMIGNLTTTNKTIDNVTINSVNKTFTLTLVNGTNASQTIDYTGDVGVYNSTGDLIGTVTMKNGTAIVDAKTLPGLVDGENVLTFEINNNYASEPVDVTINTVQLPTDIIADNVTTTNNTNIIIKGTVTNATEGIVTVELYDKDNNLIAASIAIVNDDGTFNVAFANYANGVYTATIDYNSTTGLSKNNTKNITVTVNGTAPAPTGNITTNLTINSNFTEAYGEGLNLTGKLTDANGNPIVGQHIALNLTNPTTGASKIYWVTTDTNGEYQLQINLFVGSYTASASYGGFTTADNTTTYLPSGPANGTITVTNGTEPVDNRTATVLSFSNFTETYGQALNFTGTLKTTDGTPIIGQKIGMILSNAAGQSKLYWRTTDSAGEVQLPIELFAGDYTFKCYFEGDSTYQPSNNQTGSITVTA